MAVADATDLAREQRARHRGSMQHVHVDGAETGVARGLNHRDQLAHGAQAVEPFGGEFLGGVGQRALLGLLFSDSFWASHLLAISNEHSLVRDGQEIRDHAWICRYPIRYRLGNLLRNLFGNLRSHHQPLTNRIAKPAEMPRPRRDAGVAQVCQTVTAEFRILDDVLPGVL